MRPLRPAAIVAETFAPGTNLSQIARRHGLNRGLLFTWRRQVRRARPGPVADATSEEGQGPAFVPVEIEDVVGRPPGSTVSDARSPTPLVGHSVRSSVLCGPVSCREVDDVATTNESVARLECGGADGVDAVEPVAAYAGGSGRAGGGVAGGCRRAELHSRRAEGRTPR